MSLVSLNVVSRTTICHPVPIDPVFLHYVTVESVNSVLQVQTLLSCELL